MALEIFLPAKAQSLLLTTDERQAQHKKHSQKKTDES